MILDRYELKAGHSLTTFEFLSEGRKCRIIKVVEFQEMNLPNIYNLAFGDKNLETEQIDDLALT